MMTYSLHQLSSDEHGWLTVSEPRRQTDFPFGIEKKIRESRAYWNVAERWHGPWMKCHLGSFPFALPPRSAHRRVVLVDCWLFPLKACQLAVPHLVIFQVPEQ